jgi:hypothetical protein
MKMARDVERQKRQPETKNQKKTKKKQNGREQGPTQASECWKLKLDELKLKDELRRSGKFEIDTATATKGEECRRSTGTNCCPRTRR